MDDLIRATTMDWSDIDPSILGTLFERGLDPDKRSQLRKLTNSERVCKDGCCERLNWN